jgi:hypothetical protein
MNHDYLEAVLGPHPKQTENARSANDIPASTCSLLQDFFVRSIQGICVATNRRTEPSAERPQVEHRHEILIVRTLTHLGTHVDR